MPQQQLCPTNYSQAAVMSRNGF